MSDQLIEIAQDGEDTIVLRFKTGFEAGAMVFPFKFTAGSAWATTLLFWHLTKRLQSALEDVRREAYAEGWKDAKAKKSAKQTWFSSRWS